MAVTTGEESYARSNYPAYITFYEGPDSGDKQVTRLLFPSIDSGDSSAIEYQLDFTPRLLDIRASSTDGAQIEVLDVSIDGEAIDLSWAFPIFLDGRPYG